jgi:hypothetical protein
MPTAFVINAVIRGALPVGTTFRAICAGTPEGSCPRSARSVRVPDI